MTETMISLSKEKESHPLLRRTFLVTRTVEGNEIERKKLESLGAKVVMLPTIEIQPPSSWNPFDTAIGSIEEFDWILFTSANGVRMFFERLGEDARKSLRAQFACVGPSTKEELEKHGFSAKLVPSEFLTERLGEELSNYFPLDGKKILLARAEVASNAVTKSLKRAGAQVVEAPVYRTMKMSADMSNIIDGVTDITLTSPSTVEALLTSIKPEGIGSRKIKIHCIGPVTAKRARELGLHVDSIASVHTIDGLMTSLVSGKVGA